MRIFLVFVIVLKIVSSSSVRCNTRSDNGVAVEIVSEDERADAYEVSMSLGSNLDSRIAAKRVRKSSPTTVVHFESALKDHSYVFSIRAHNKNSDFYSSGENWIQDFEANLKCLNDTRPHTAAKTTSSYPRMIVVRQSEFTNEIDYLANHDSGDFEGDSAFLTVTATNNSASSIINVSFVNSTFTQYCVEYVPASLSFPTRNGNQSYFADYVSCNFEEPITPSSPSW